MQAAIRLLLRLVGVAGLTLAAVAGCNVTCSASSQRVGWDGGTGSLSGKIAASAAVDCCARCQHAARCTTWVFSLGESACWLKSNDRGGEVSVP